MEFRAARGNDHKGFEVLIPVGGHRLLLSRGSNRSGFRLRWRDEAPLQAEASGIQQIGESRLDDFPQLGACRTEPEQAGDSLDQLISLRFLTTTAWPGTR